MIPRTSTVMLTVPPMLALADTVATTLMVVVLVLPAMPPTLADKVLPCVSEPPVEIDVQQLAEVVMLVNTLELDFMQMRVTVPEAAELLVVVVLATLVNALLAYTETFQMLVLLAVELLQLVVVEVLMVVPEATASMVQALVATAVFAVMVAQLDMAVILAATATELEEATALAATELAEVATALVATVVTEPAATAAMVMAIELVIMVK